MHFEKLYNPVGMPSLKQALRGISDVLELIIVANVTMMVKTRLQGGFEVHESIEKALGVVNGPLQCSSL